jgi:hypothetical protein
VSSTFRTHLVDKSVRLKRGRCDWQQLSNVSSNYYRGRLDGTIQFAHQLAKAMLTHCLQISCEGSRLESQLNGTQKRFKSRLKDISLIVS